MAVTKYAKEDIIPLIIHVLSFSTMKFAEYGYHSVVENEVTPLKGLAENDIKPVMYFELLEASDDKISKAILECIALIDTTVDTFCLLYNIDLDELYSNEQIHEQASSLYFDLFNYADGLIESDIEEAITELPFATANTLFFLCKLIIHQEIDQEFLMEDGLHGKGSQELEFMDTSNNNVAILHDLIDQMLALNLEISSIYANRNNQTL
ncbi:hypothetical protein TH53_10735 [Pedobacter lusitanus]|uniref:Uncharacterized protein n=1 Tax=Pedobacter lusitanus TaxID=1503925 RepID=A0A0D0F654_9SPHI|nr:hypothetical protein [Pedobacter lusitanus]KIO77118.1 hypothetical protein TH53_10735 [Pedobacter lusitanus]